MDAHGIDCLLEYRLCYSAKAEFIGHFRNCLMSIGSPVCHILWNQNNLYKYLAFLQKSISSIVFSSSSPLTNSMCSRWLQQE